MTLCTLPKHGSQRTIPNNHELALLRALLPAELREGLNQILNTLDRHEAAHGSHQEIGLRPHSGQWLALPRCSETSRIGTCEECSSDRSTGSAVSVLLRQHQRHSRVRCRAAGLRSPRRASMRLVEIAPKITVDEIRAKTEAGFHVDPKLN